jgi:hypothetical protein
MFRRAVQELAGLLQFRNAQMKLGGHKYTSSVVFGLGGM